MSIDNVFTEELDYEMDDLNENELLLSDDEARDCEIVKLMSSTSVTSPQNELKVAEMEAADEELVKDVLFTPEEVLLMPEEVQIMPKEVLVTPKEVVLITSYPLNLQSSNDLWEKSIATYSAIVNKTSSPTNDAVQSDVLKKTFITPQREKISAPEEVQRQEHSKEWRKAVTYDDVMDLDALQVFSPMISLPNLEANGFGEMNGSADITVANHTNGYASDLAAKFDLLSTNPMTYKEKGDSSFVDLRIEKSAQPNINGNLNGFVRQPIATTEKIPFIIELNATSRNVRVNPLFDGFSRNIRNKGNVSLIRKRERSRNRNTSPYNSFTYSDLRKQILKKRKPVVVEFDSTKKSDREVKRKPINILVASNSTNKSDQVVKRKPINIVVASNSTKKSDQESPKEILILTDEDEHYLKEIEKQKLKREKIIRQKEINRQKEGWSFN